MNSTPPPTTTPVVIEGEARPAIDTPQGDALHLLTNFLLGAGIEGVDLVLEHTRAWQQRFAATPRLLPVPKSQESNDLLRYALIGLLFDTEDRLRRDLAWWGNQVLRSAGAASSMARPLTDSWLMAPLQRPMRSLSLQLQSDLTRLIRRGRMEEAVSRLMATEITDELISVILDYLSDKPEVRRMIEQQGTTLAGEVVDEVRNQSEEADNFVESIVRRILNMAPRQPSPPPASGD